MNFLTGITIADIAALILAIVAFIKVFWRTPTDKLSEDSTRVDITERLQAMHTSSLDMINKLQNELDEEVAARRALRNEFENLQQEVSQLRAAIRVRDMIIEQWKCGIDELTDQIENELNAKPRWRPFEIEEGDL